jgi:hypothetical protein
VDANTGPLVQVHQLADVGVRRTRGVHQEQRTLDVEAPFRGRALSFELG